MKSDRIKLINCSQEILEAILDGDDSLAKLLDIRVPANWSEFGQPAFAYSLDKIKENPEGQKWWTYLPIHAFKKVLIGSCGFKGAPDKDGMVELGYEVIESYRNQGYAREITNMLVKTAFGDDEVKKVWAPPAAKENPSASVLAKCNFTKIDEIEDEEDGMIWRWERKRQA